MKGITYPPTICTNRTIRAPFKRRRCSLEGGIGANGRVNKLFLNEIAIFERFLLKNLPNTG